MGTIKGSYKKKIRRLYIKKNSVTSPELLMNSDQAIFFAMDKFECQKKSNRLTVCFKQ